MRFGFVQTLDQLSHGRIVGGQTSSDLKWRPGIGTCREFGSDTADMADLSGTASYIEVRPAVTVFTELDFRGRRQGLTRGLHLAPDLNIVGNDAVTSIVVPPGVYAYVCTDRPGIGTCTWYTSDTYYVGATMNNRASSIYVW